VEVAVREVHTSAREADSARAAMKAAQSEVDYLDERWQVLPGDDQAASFLLQDLLDAQDRLAETERAVVAAQVSFALAHCQLKRSMGTLLDCEQIVVQRACDGCTPRLILEKTGPSCRVGPGGIPR
jgi:outer membrane protein TolC